MAKEAAKKKDDAEEKDEKKDAKEEKKEEKKDDKKGAKEGETKEGEGGEGAEGEGAPKKSKKKIIIIGAAALVVLLGGVAGAYFAGLFGGKQEEEAAGHGEGKDGKPVAAAVYYTLPEFLVNLNSGGKQVSFLKATIVLELESGIDVQPLEGALPKLMDAFNTYLRELRSSDLAGSAGIQRLREELLLRANKAAAPIKINDVLFKSILVQ